MTQLSIKIYIKIPKRFTGKDKLPGKIVEAASKGIALANKPTPPTSTGVVTHKPAASQQPNNPSSKPSQPTEPTAVPNDSMKVPNQSTPSSTSTQSSPVSFFKKESFKEKAAVYVAHKTNAPTTHQQTQATPVSSQLPTPQQQTNPELPVEPIAQLPLQSTELAIPGEGAISNPKGFSTPNPFRAKSIESGLFTVADATLKLPTKPKEELDGVDDTAPATPKNPISDQATPIVMPSPNNYHPLMLTDGQALGEPQKSTLPRLQESSVFFNQDNSDVTEHLLATPSGLVPISSSFADDPYVVQLTFNVLDKEAMLKRHDPRTVKLIEILFEYGLLDLHGKNGCEGYRPNKHFRLIWSKLFKNGLNVEDVVFTQSDLQTYLDKFSVDICVLAVKEEHELTSVFLLPEQTHVGLYSVIANKKIFWSFFTSDQDENNFIISSYQPFGDDINKNNRPQLLRVLVPRSILDNDLMPMPSMTMAQAQAFLSKSEVQEMLKKNFIEKIMPHLQDTKAVFVYDGIGITSSQTEAVIIEYQRELFVSAEIKFKTYYVNKLKLELQDPKRTDLQDWMHKIEKKAPREYKYVVQLANEYNEKNNIPKRYEIFT